MRLVVLGATGAVGRTMLQVLEERAFPVEELVPLASERSAGTAVTWRDREWAVQEPRAGVFRACDVALFSAGSALSREWAPRAAAEGAVVVDNSSAWRMDPEVPLVVPEVNGAVVQERVRGIIANPNCSTIQMVVVLEAIRRVAGLARVLATTYQSVSGAGQRGVEALRAELMGGEAAASPFVAPIAGNVIPFIGPRGDDGWNEEETKMRLETRKILASPTLAVSATCVRVPVEVGHAIALMVETREAMDVAQACTALADMPGVVLHDHDDDPYPLDVAGSDQVHVGHLRADPDRADTLHLWVVADNLRKGAATNAVQIAELLGQPATTRRFGV